MQEESIYNIIPQEYVPPPKGRMYRSKYSPEVPPTSSTFINHTTSRPGVFFDSLKMFHIFLLILNWTRLPMSKATRTWDSKPTPTKAIPSHSALQKELRSPTRALSWKEELELATTPEALFPRVFPWFPALIPSISRASLLSSPLVFPVHHENSLEKYYSESRKEAIPKKSDKPIMGLKSDKNFIVSNAVDNITAGKHSPTACFRLGMGLGWETLVFANF